MFETAVSDIGLSPSEFWELSWYEWGLYLLRLKKRNDKEKVAYEEQWQRTRILWATIINVNGGKVKPTDLIKLSFDGKSEKEQPPEPGEVIKRFTEKIGK